MIDQTDVVDAPLSQSVEAKAPDIAERPVDPAAVELDRKAREAYEAIGTPGMSKAAPVVLAEDGPTDYSDIERTYVEEFDAEGWAAIAPDRESSAGDRAAGSRIQRGDLRFANGLAGSDAEPRLVLVLSVDSRLEFAEVLLVHTAVEMACDVDAIVPVAVSGAPYAVVVETDLRGAVWTLQLSPEVGHLDETVITALAPGHEVSTAGPASGVSHGIRLAGPVDPRWGFKADEGAAFRSLTRDCTDALLDEGQVDEFDVAGTAPLELYESTTDPANVANIVEADGPTPHPAKFSPTLLAAIEDVLQEYHDGPARILDPFAGVGGIHVLRDPDRGGHETWGVELEPEWAQQSPFTVTGDSRNLSGLKELGPWDAIVTSPAYGNRMADSYDGRDGSRRHTYRISLGRPLTEGNTGALHWRNDEYRQLHSEVWAECAGLVRPGGLVIINVSNFIANHVEQHVVEWHLQSWLHLGFKLIEARRVTTPRMKHGANHDARVAGEMLLVLEAPK